MSAKSLVSFICATRNQARFLPQALDSMINQTYRHIEIIMVDDASTDQTAEILKRYASRDPRLKIITHQQRQYLAKSLNEAIGTSTGTFLARMDSDDISYPDRLKIQMAYLMKNPATDLVASFADLIDEYGRLIGAYQSPTAWKSLQAEMIKRNPLIHPSWMLRRSLIDQAGGYPEWFKYAQDYAFLQKIIWKHQVVVIPQSLIQYRRTQQQFNPIYYYQQIGYMVAAKIYGYLFKFSSRI